MSVNSSAFLHSERHHVSTGSIKNSLQSFGYSTENYGMHYGWQPSAVYHRQTILLFYLRQNEPCFKLTKHCSQISHHTHKHTLHFSLSLPSKPCVSSYWIIPSFLSSSVPSLMPLISCLCSHQSVRSEEPCCCCTLSILSATALSFNEHTLPYDSFLSICPISLGI